MVAAVGAPAALFIDVASFLDLRRAADRPAPTRRGSGRARCAPGCARPGSTSTRCPPARAAARRGGRAASSSSPAPPIEVAFAKATLHAGDRGYGLLLAHVGAGAVLGSLVFRALDAAAAWERSCGAGTLAIGLAYVGLALRRRSRWRARRRSWVASATACSGPSLISAVQRLTPQHLHGRLMGAVESLGASVLAIGLAARRRPGRAELAACGVPRGRVGGCETTAAFVRHAAAPLPGTDGMRGSSDRGA